MGGASSSARTTKAVTYDGSVAKECLFCKLVAGRAPVDRLYMDGVCCAFVPRSPDAMGHVLIVPRRHLKNLSEVGPEDAQLLEHMRAVGERVLALSLLQPPGRGPVAADGSLAEVDEALASREHGLARALACSDTPAAMAASLAPEPPAGIPDPGRSGKAGAGLAEPLFAFHAPPYNSIDHLHLHCLSPPYASPCKALSHWAGASWSPTLEQVVRGLKRDSRL